MKDVDRFIKLSDQVSGEHNFFLKNVGFRGI